MSIEHTLGSPTSTVLVVAPMPAAPASAGNRKRLSLICSALQRAGFAVDFAYFAHEDQVYRRFGQHPPTDLAKMSTTFQRTFLIETQDIIPLKTRSPAFGIDEWGSTALDRFVSWYAEEYSDTVAILVNYVFLSRCLDHAPNMLKIIDTHDRFADRQLQYRPFRAEPNFYYTDSASEAAALDRADVVLAIQSEEAAHFAALTDRQVLLLPPMFPVRSQFSAPYGIRKIGFVGHGNDPNLFSIGKFAHEWAAGWTPDRPELRIAGEICNALGSLNLPGVSLLGYVDDLAAFYADTDLIVAPMLMGSGLKMKVAEALSYGVPVVGTEIGFEGFDAEAPAHKCAGVAAVKATILKLQSNPVALKALTEACAELLERFNAMSQQAEAELASVIKASIRGRSASVVPAAAFASSAASVESVGQSWPICVRSANSLLSDDPAHGQLLATERFGEDAALATQYSPERRRWFAGSTPPLEKQSSIGPVSVALSPEWVRGKRLTREIRESAAYAFRDILADWTTQCRCVGVSSKGFVLAVPMPSHLLTGTPAIAAFLIAADGAHAHELAIDGIAPLSLSPGYAFKASRLDLTPVPAIVKISCMGPASVVANGTVLFLTDDLIGRITIVPPPIRENIRP
ncbi:glycosyltransferase [Methylobacterium sp. 37f]|uniref:glycosyltransferase n=1 Tax=Methylobacterium sp. 37f TaxID=2817058 RepID=UPI001FFC53EA|nr:glycosyltransferase [Methylobacterium sp. 37f]MCK2056374.1 glycosyltransferase [Methylobacterium sp. 37f]